MTSQSTSGPSPVSATVNNRYQLNTWTRRSVLADEYLAHDLHLDRTVVFKAILPSLVSDKAFLDRFRLQAQATANLNHPAIASVLDWGRDPIGIPDGHGAMRQGPTYYLVAEQPQGKTLSELVLANGAMPPERVAHVMIGLTAALGFAHRAGVVGAGLHPDRIHVSPSGVIKVVDLGLTRSLGDSWLPDETESEAAQWMAPEQFRGEPVSEQTDVYQIGLLAYFLTTGTPPYTGTTTTEVEYGHLDRVPLAPTKVNARTPKSLESFIGKSMAKSGDDRYSTITEQRAAVVRLRDRLSNAAQTAASSTSGPASVPGRATSPVPGNADDQTELIRRPSQLNDVSANLRPGQLRPVAVKPTQPDTTTVVNRVERAPANTTNAPGRPTPVQVDRSAKSPTQEPDDATAVAPRTGAMSGRASYEPGVMSGRASYEPGVMSGRASYEPGAMSGRASYEPGVIRDDGSLPSGPENSFSDLERRRPRRWLYLLTLLVLLGVLGGLLLLLAKQLGFSGTTTGSVVVPAVEHRAVSEATQTLSDLGLRVETERITSATEEKDIVVHQAPLAGVKLSEGALVTLQVSMGSTQPTVPLVTAMTVDQAKSLLATYGFQWVIDQRPDDSAEPGTVTSQEPRADATVAPGATIRLTVAVSASQKEIPKLDGKTVEEARVALTKEGFLIVVQPEPSNSVEKDVVIRTEPAGGVSVAKGSSVLIVTSGGKALTVPSVIGRDEAEARKTLEALGIVVVTRQRTELDPNKIGKVVSQTPSADDNVEIGGTVTIRVGTDSSSVTTRVRAAQSTTDTVAAADPGPAPLQTVPTTPPATTAPAVIEVASTAPTPAPAAVSAGVAAPAVASPPPVQAAAASSTP
jgi:eukaryotic-like serine/threonine-protein kinase